MARYVIRKCLFCNRTIEFEHKERSEYSNYIGLPWQRCPYCKQIYATGLKFYIDMTEEEKQKLKDCRIGNFISNMFMNLILITVVVAIATVFLRNLEISFFNTINNEIAVPIAVILVSLFSIFLAIIGTENDFKEVMNITIDSIENLDEDIELKELNLKYCTSNKEKTIK